MNNSQIKICTYIIISGTVLYTILLYVGSKIFNDTEFEIIEPEIENQNLEISDSSEDTESFHIININNI